MANTDDDAIPQGYQYEWTPKSEGTLHDFLGKYKPSMVQNDGSKPWLWVAKADRPSDIDGADAAVKEAADYLAEVTDRVQKIKNDDSIPVRANKKKGLRSKKELREEVQNEATQKLKEISVNHGYVSGKWLTFVPADKVDMIWSSLANSLVSGPLSSTPAFLAKVATSPQNDTPNYLHLICVYIPDAYDQGSVTEVMKVLLRNHGLNLTGVKADLYTSIGLDSHHASGVSSTVWKNTVLMKDTEIKALKDEYFAELNTAKTAATEEAAAKKAESGAVTKPKPKLKKKAGADDPFASDEEDESKEEQKQVSKKAAMPASSSGSKAKKPVPNKKAATNDFGSDDDDADGEAARKAEVKAKKAGTTKKRKAADSDDESADEAPRKKGRA